LPVSSIAWNTTLKTMIGGTASITTAKVCPTSTLVPTWSGSMPSLSGRAPQRSRQGSPWPIRQPGRDRHRSRGSRDGQVHRRRRAPTGDLRGFSLVSSRNWPMTTKTRQPAPMAVRRTTCQHSVLRARLPAVSGPASRFLTRWDRLAPAPTEQNQCFLGFWSASGPIKIRSPLLYQLS
jgi:hypothetical protein